MELQIPTYEYRHVWPHGSYAKADKKQSHYEAGEASCAINPLRESRTSKDG